MFAKLKELVKDFFSIWNDPAVRLLPAHLAFFAVLSLAPVLIIIFFLAQQFDLPLQDFVNPLETLLPGIVDTVVSPTESQASGLSMGIWLIVTFVVGSTGVSSIIAGSNALYGFDTANYVVRRVKAFLLTIMLVALLLVGIAIIEFGDYLGSFLSSWLQTFVSIARWVLVCLIAFAAVKFIFMTTPRTRIKSRFTTAGAIFTTAGWIVATIAYSIYFNYFSNYDQYYGSLTNFIVLMIWVYILSNVFVVGIIINVYQFRKAAASSAASSHNEKAGLPFEGDGPIAALAQSAKPLLANGTSDEELYSSLKQLRNEAAEVRHSETGHKRDEPETDG